MNRRMIVSFLALSLMTPSALIAQRTLGDEEPSKTTQTKKDPKTTTAKVDGVRQDATKPDVRKDPADKRRDDLTKLIPAPVNREGSAEARKSLVEAQDEIRKQELTVAVMPINREAEFRGTAEYQEALEAYRAAYLELESLRRPIREELKARPDYQAAHDTKTAAQKQVSRLHGGEAVTPDDALTFAEIMRCATEALNAGMFMTRLEADAMSADPRIVAARGKLVDSWLRLSVMRLHFLQTLRSSPELEKAREQLESARLRYKQSSQKLADALAREAVAERERQRKLEELVSRINKGH